MPKPDPRPSVRTSALRSWVEHRSDGVLRSLASLPPAAPLLAAVVLAVTGAVVRGVIGAVCFGVLTVFLGWLLYLSWPRLSALDRLMRGSVLLLTAVVTVVLTASVL